MARLRHAACLLADVGWHANPEFRAERGVEIALHGNWVAIDARGRAIIAQALWTSLGGGSGTPSRSTGSRRPPTSSARCNGAWRCGSASACRAASPGRSSARSWARTARALTLHLAGDDVALYGEAVAEAPRRAGRGMRPQAGADERALAAAAALIDPFAIDVHVQPIVAIVHRHASARAAARARSSRPRAASARSTQRRPSTCRADEICRAVRSSTRRSGAAGQRRLTGAQAASDTARRAAELLHARLPRSASSAACR